jgi:xylulose-5-phosphate/fructose-6-phosphate phosphoketolase
VLDDLDRFHLVMDTISRLPQTGDKGIYLCANDARRY